MGNWRAEKYLFRTLNAGARGQAEGIDRECETQRWLLIIHSAERLLQTSAAVSLSVSPPHKCTSQLRGRRIYCWATDCICLRVGHWFFKYFLVNKVTWAIAVFLIGKSAVCSIDFACGWMRTTGTRSATFPPVSSDLGCSVTGSVLAPCVPAF